MKLQAKFVQMAEFLDVHTEQALVTVSVLTHTVFTQKINLLGYPSPRPGARFDLRIRFGNPNRTEVRGCFGLSEPNRYRG